MEELIFFLTLLFMDRGAIFLRGWCNHFPLWTGLGFFQTIERLVDANLGTGAANLNYAEALVRTQIF